MSSITLHRPTSAAAFCDISYPTLRRLLKRGDFPAPVRLAGRGIAFDERDLAAWKTSRSAPG